MSHDHEHDAPDPRALRTEALEKLLVFGPGSIAQAHTHDEWIALEQLERGTEMYARLIRHWCC